ASCGKSKGSDDATSETKTVESSTSKDSSSSSKASTTNDSSSTTKNSSDSEESTTSTDISGISSGSASVSFKYGNQTTTKTINAAYLIDGQTVTITEGTYKSASSSSDQVVFLVINGGKLIIKGTNDSHVEVTKSGSAASSGQVGDDYNFYGINSGIVVSGSESSATIEYCDITTSSNGSNAVVATNSGSVNITNSTITSTGSAGSRGLHTTYDGVIVADSVEIQTQGASCASLANDRGGGSITASNMTLQTNSAGSPLVYSTDYIKVIDSTGSANSAQAVVVEGGSTAYLDGCDFTCTGTGNRQGTSDSNSSTHTIDAGGVFIYQSVSGDSEEGTDYFYCIDTTITVTEETPMIYMTNITAEITISGSTFSYASGQYFLLCEATNQWGTTGKNGATATVKADFEESSVSTYSGSTSSISWTVSS
ncbi:MAG: hypothetical protein K6E20_00950, partial [Acholeplasmatales bacterium]|nr:hypothetical protein [Acholeplasmatales bacterium]